MKYKNQLVVRTLVVFSLILGIVTLISTSYLYIVLLNDFVSFYFKDILKYFSLPILSFLPAILNGTLAYYLRKNPDLDLKNKLFFKLSIAGLIASIISIIIIYLYFENIAKRFYTGF